MFIFFFQAEDGIRDKLVTGVQTCALPILAAECNAGSPGIRSPRDAAGTIHSSRKSTTAATTKSCPQERRSTPRALRRREDTPPTRAPAPQSSPPAASAADRAAILPTAA